MSGIIWLITEDENDYRIVRHILDKRNIAVSIKWRSPTGKTPGVSRLAKELPTIIKDINALRTENDCIAVLHDDDVHQQPDRTNYQLIKQVCQQHNVRLVVAKDEIEAWLLSDSGICRWLEEQTIKAWNGQPRTKEKLIELLRKKKLHYPRDLDKVLHYLKADGTNESLQTALKHLENAPCVSK